MQYILTTFLSGLVALGVTLGGWFLPQKDIEPLVKKTVEEQIKVSAEQILGVNDVQLAALPTYFLSGSGVSSSAASIVLTSLTIPQSTYQIQDSDLSDVFYITLEPGNRTRQEIASCTTVTQGATSATLSGCTRGLSPITPFTASSTLQFAHAGGTRVIFSDPPQAFNRFASKSNDENILRIWTFSSTNTPRYNSNPTFSNNNDLINKKYADDLAIAGAGTSTETGVGLVQLGKTGEVGLGTASSTTAKPLVLKASVATSTYDAALAGDKIPVTNSSGQINANFIATTSPYNWTGSHTFTASTTHSGSATTTFTGPVDFSATPEKPIELNGVAYSFGTQGATSSVFATDGLGKIYSVSQDWTQLGETISASAAASTTVTGLSARQDLRIIVEIPSIASAESPRLFFGTPSAQGNLWGTELYQGVTRLGGGNAVNQLSFLGGSLSTTTASYWEINVSNTATRAKKGTFKGTVMGGAGAVPPESFWGSFVWNNTSAQITKVEIACSVDGAVNCGAGTRVSVYGKRD